MNGTIAIIVLHDIDLHFQVQTFSCYALVLKNVQAVDGVLLVCDAYMFNLTNFAIKIHHKDHG